MVRQAQFRYFLRKWAKEKERTGDVLDLTSEDEKILDQIWDGLSEPAEEEGHEKKGYAAKTDSKEFRAFWKEVYEGGKRKFPNPNPDSKKSHPQVSANTLLKSSKPFRDKVFKDYAKWRKKNTGAPKPAKKRGKSFLSPDRYKDAEFQLLGRSKAILKKHGLTPESVADMCGMGSLPPGTKSIYIQSMAKGYLDVSIEYESPKKGMSIEIMRYVYPDEKKIKNDALIVTGAPPGVGTRIFASQIEAARAAGFESIECSARTEPPDWVGGIVWPKLGYDGPLPSSEDYDPDSGFNEGWSKKAEKIVLEFLSKQGFKKPYRVSMLMKSEEGRKLWKKYVPEWLKLTFDLSKSSQASKVLKAYLEKKGLP